MRCRAQRGLKDFIPVLFPIGKHPFPFRTRKLRLSGPMVLIPQGIVRVGRCRVNFYTKMAPVWANRLEKPIMKFTKVLLAVSIAIFIRSLAFSSEIIFPASQLEKGKLQISLYGSMTKKDLTLSASNREQISVGQLNYFSQVTNEFDVQTLANNVTAKLLINPADGLYYWMKAGTGSFELEIPSVTVKNKLSTQQNGLIIGLGVRKRLIPDTIVTPAAAVELAINYSKFNLDKFRSGSDAPVLIPNVLEDLELQIGFIVSKKIDNFEPFAGLKILRDFVRIYDSSDLSEISGVKDNVSLSLGSKIKVFSQESLLIEANFIGENSFTIGWNVAF